MQSPGTVKEQARRLVEQLPDNSTWEDLMREVFVRQAIARGMTDREAGRTMDVAEVRRRLGVAK